MRRIIFSCIHNAGQSQMAAAFFNAMADPQKAIAISAGTQPGERVQPEVVLVMREVGIDLSRRKPCSLTPELVSGAEMVVTMRCGEDYPFYIGILYEEWPMPDPKGMPLEHVRVIRDAIFDHVRALVVAHAWAREDAALCLP